MAMPIKFDTLEYTRNLMEAGIPPADAEAHANALSIAMAEATVSPGELLLLRTDVLARIEMLRMSVDAKLDALQMSMDAKIDMLNAKIIALRTEMKARFTPLYLMVGLSLALHVVTLVKLFS